MSFLPESRGGWNKRQNLRKRVVVLHKQRPQRSNPGSYLLYALTWKSKSAELSL